MKAFGLFDATQKNIYVALLAGISSYFLAKRQTQSMTVTPEPGKEGGFQEQFMKSMQIQLLYVLPVIIVISGAVLPAALSLYWFVSNVIGYIQDVYMKNKLAHLK
jgi:membrane protein insertase Oxa1/YidC/SpoIIIJ